MCVCCARVRAFADTLSLTLGGSEGSVKIGA